MSHLLEFDLRYKYDTLEEGITIPSVLRLSGQTAYCDAKVDRGRKSAFFSARLAKRSGWTSKAGIR